MQRLLDIATLSEKIILKGIDEVAVYGDGNGFALVDRNDPDHHRALIVLWMECGAKEPPSSVELAAVIMTMSADFPKLNMGHLRRSVQMAFQGALDEFGDKEKLRMYGAPNLQFLVACMSAFSRYRRSQVEMIESVQRSMKSRWVESNVTGITPQETWEGLVEIYERDKAMPIAWPKDTAYGYAVENGLIEVSEEEKKEIADKVRARMAMNRNPLLRGPVDDGSGVDISKHLPLGQSALEKAMKKISGSDFKSECREEVLRRRLSSGNYRKSNQSEVKK